MKPGSLAVTEEQDGVQKENNSWRACGPGSAESFLLYSDAEADTAQGYFQIQTNQVQDRLQSSEPSFHPHFQLGEE